MAGSEKLPSMPPQTGRAFARGRRKPMTREQNQLIKKIRNLSSEDVARVLQFLQQLKSPELRVVTKRALQEIIVDGWLACAPAKLANEYVRQNGPIAK